MSVYAVPAANEQRLNLRNENVNIQSGLANRLAANGKQTWTSRLRSRRLLAALMLSTHPRPLPRDGKSSSRLTELLSAALAGFQSSRRPGALMTGCSSRNFRPTGDA